MLRQLVRWLLLCGFWLLSFTQLQAQPLLLSSGDSRVHLLELYTSQGCNSCPPAEEWLNRFTGDPRLWREVIPLAFHVDYWDYLGWKDPFSNPLFSRRQQTYRQQGGTNAVYTPGFFLNGRQWRPDITRTLRLALEKAPILTLRVDPSGVTALLEGAEESPLDLNLALLGFAIETEVNSGENSGERLPQEFVVLGFSQQHSTNNRWQGSLPLPVNHPVQRFALVAWISASDQQAPLQAVGGWLPASLLNAAAGQ